MQKRGLNRLAAICAPQLKESLSKAGFAATEIVTQWEAIVGAAIARRSRPVKISFPRRPTGSDIQDPGTLHIAVESAFALEVQHMSGTILERVNAYFGWASVQVVKVKVVPALAPRATKPRHTSAMQPETVEKQISGIEDEGLKLALRKLGTAISKP